jgi:S-ribosylhomocysteine lyase LuxS involved in autoinducer biosynthesis
MLTVRCKECGVELTSHPTRTRCCGCSNMTTVRGEVITALDLSRVVMISNDKDIKKASIFTTEDLAYQNARRNRKVRRLDFEVR